MTLETCRVLEHGGLKIVGIGRDAFQNPTQSVRGVFEV